MSSIYKGMVRIDEGIQWFEKALLIFLFALAVAVGTAQVVSRYALSASLPWSEEMLRYILIWISFFASSLGFSMTNVHTNVDLVISRLKPGANAFFEILWRIVCLAFSTSIAILSISVLQSSRVTGQVTAAMRLPMWYIYSGVVVSLFLMSYHLLIAILERGIRFLQNKGGQS